MADLLPKQSNLKLLIAKGKEQGYLTYSEVNDHLPESISDPDQVEDIIQMINDMGITVVEKAADIFWTLKKAGYAVDGMLQQDLDQSMDYFGRTDRYKNAFSDKIERDKK